jgi:hypothetical protein
MAANPSGRFVLRTPPALHGALRRAARRAGLSLNAYCVRHLGTPAAERISDPPAVVVWARHEFGDALHGVVVYGSWARGEATGESDVDVLVVLNASAVLTRDMYRTCDATSLSWDGHPVQVQIVRMPDADHEAGGGLWPEIALDGIVMFERDDALSRRLVTIRRAIADGRLVRRTAHGQPYWTTKEAA